MTGTKRLQGAMLVLTTAAVVATTLASSASSRTQQRPVLRIAAATALHEAPFFQLDKYAEKYGFDVQTVQLQSFADKGRALQRGDVDAALLGYTNIAQYAQDGVRNVRVVAGGWWGQQWLVVRKGSGIRTWADLRGKTIGAPPGSYAYIAWLNGLKEHNLSNDVKQVNVSFDAATVGQAFRSGALDGVVHFAPFTDSWVLEGFAEYPPTNFVQDTSLGSATGLVVIGDKLLADRALGTRLVRAVVDLQEDMMKNRGAWAQIVTQISGVRDDIARAAVRRGCTAFPVETDTLVSFGKIAPQFGVTRADVSAQMPQLVDLSFVRRATGLTATEVTATPSCAPAGRRNPSGTVGTRGNDLLRGTAGADRMSGLAGRDVLQGLPGNDRLDGGTDNDRLSGGKGSDTLLGSAGRDVLNGDDGNDRMDGGAGNDVLNGGAGSDQLIGGKGTNGYSGGAGNDRINSKNGQRETVRCGPGRDTVSADKSDRLLGCERRR